MMVRSRSLIAVCLAGSSSTKGHCLRNAPPHGPRKDSGALEIP
jgi:hypothetical protein